MDGYETVNNPYEAGTGTYPPPAPPAAAAAAAPPVATAPPGWVQNPDGTWSQVAAAPPAPPAAAPPPPAAVAAPPAAGGYPTGAPAGGYPTGATAAPAAGAPPVPPAGGSAGGDYEAKPIVKLPTQNGQPLDQLNLVMMTGYFQHIRDNNNNPRFSQTSNTTRLGFIIAEEQTWVDSATGQQQSKVVKHRCVAWGEHATNLVQVYDGTPIKIWGNLTIYYPRDDQGKITGSIVDIKVNKYEFP